MNILLPEKENHLIPRVNAKAMAIVSDFSQEHEADSGMQE